jgi:hypothetical protein
MPTGETKGPWQRHRSQVMYRSRWFAVHRDDVTRPDGSPGVYDRADIPSSVRVLAVDAHQRVALPDSGSTSMTDGSYSCPAGPSIPLTQTRRRPPSGSPPRRRG